MNSADKHELARMGVIYGEDLKPTKHASTCKMAFGRKDPKCPRCQELLAGSAPRAGWQRDHFDLSRRQEESRSASIAAHFGPGGPHAAGKCGPVCTFGDW